MPPQPKPTAQPPSKKGSNISNMEWALIISATAIVDIIQIILDLFVIGALFNRFIDVVVGAALPFYFWIRGVKLDSKKVITWITSFAAEEVPVLDALPLWTGDVLMTMAWDKVDKRMGNNPVGQVVGHIGPGSTRDNKRSFSKAA